MHFLSFGNEPAKRERPRPENVRRPRGLAGKRGPARSQTAPRKRPPCGRKRSLRARERERERGEEEGKITRDSNFTRHAHPSKIEKRKYLSELRHVLRAIAHQLLDIPPASLPVNNYSPLSRRLESPCSVYLLVTSG